MKDYTEEIGESAQYIFHAYTQDEIYRRVSELVSIIRKDVERSEEYYNTVISDKNIEIEQLRAEKDKFWLDRENLLMMLSDMREQVSKLKLEVNNLRSVNVKSDSERIWEMYRDLFVRYKTSSVYASIRDELIFEIAQKSVDSFNAAWKEATK